MRLGPGSFHSPGWTRFRVVGAFGSCVALPTLVFVVPKVFVTVPGTAVRPSCCCCYFLRAYTRTCTLLLSTAFKWFGVARRTKTFHTSDGQIMIYLYQADRLVPPLPPCVAVRDLHIDMNTHSSTQAKKTVPIVELYADCTAPTRNMS